VYAHLNNDKNASYDFGINAVGNNARWLAAATHGATVQGIQLGLRHSF
jgi:acyl dehydratase